MQAEEEEDDFEKENDNSDPVSLSTSCDDKDDDYDNADDFYDIFHDQSGKGCGPTFPLLSAHLLFWESQRLQRLRSLLMPVVILSPLVFTVKCLALSQVITGTT